MRVALNIYKYLELFIFWFYPTCWYTNIRYSIHL